MQMETITLLKNMEEDMQKELDGMNDSRSLKFMESCIKNVFKTDQEAIEFMETPKAKEGNMVKWKVRDDCYMVNTPDRIKAEKEQHEKYATMDPLKKKLAITMQITSMIVGATFFAFSDSRKKKFLQLKLKYVKALRMAGGSMRPSGKVFSILEKLANMFYQNAEINIGVNSDVCISLLETRNRFGIRENLDLFNVCIRIFLKNSSNEKISHMGFRLYDARGKDKRGKFREIKVVGKTGGNGERLVLSRLNKALKTKDPNPIGSIRNLYALTNMPNLRKVLPPVEEFLGELYPKLFRDDDYMNWKARRIKKTFQDAILLKSTLTIPPKQPLSIGEDETERMMECLIGSLKKWHRKKTK